MIENFNDRYQQMFLGKVNMATAGNLKTGSFVFSFVARRDATPCITFSKFRASPSPP
jgi:hypothetical protein